MWVMLPDVQIILVDNVSPPLLKKMEIKKLYYEDFA